MTTGVGGSTAQAELAKLQSLRDGVEPITVEERRARIAKAQTLMREQGVDALYLDASTSLNYFTGLNLHASERLTGAVIPADGEVTYVVPVFEEAAIRNLMTIGDDVRGWQEHEDPAASTLR